MKPLAIELFAGLHGWGAGCVEEGFRVIGFDIVDMIKYCGLPPQPHPDIQLVLQNVLTLHGSQFKDATLIVASPPCQEFSYMAMPWSRAKAKMSAIQADPNEQNRLTALFDACFRIQREACEAAGRHIPMVVENVCGAQKWVGRAKWHYGSYFLWGDVPALMPFAHKGQKLPPRTNPTDRSQRSTNLGDAIKQGGISGTRANGNGDKWFQDGIAKHGSKSKSRKAGSALIAKIPFALARWIAKCYRPEENQ